MSVDEKKVKDRFYETVCGAYLDGRKRACACCVYCLYVSTVNSEKFKYQQIKRDTADVYGCVRSDAMRDYEYGFSIIMGWECGSHRFITNKNVIIIKLGLENAKYVCVCIKHTHKHSLAHTLHRFFFCADYYKTQTTLTHKKNWTKFDGISHGTGISFIFIIFSLSLRSNQTVRRTLGSK